MPVYKYSGTDTNGKRKDGTVDARSQELAISLLKNQGLFVISLSLQKNSLLDQLKNLRGVPDNEVVAFTRQFSTMISAGLPMARALEVLADQTTHLGMKRLIIEVLRDIEGGAPLSAALARYPDQFGSTYQALVRAGESSGKLDEILRRLATTLEADRELKAKFKSAMVYPTIVFLAMIGVFIMLMVFVVPKLAEMYKSLSVELPFVTRAMIGVSDFMVKNIFILGGATVAGFFIQRSFFKSPAGKELKSRVMFGLPVFGAINRLKDITSFARTLSLLVGSAIPIVEALKIVADVVDSSAYRNAAFEAAKVVEKGNPLSEYFKYNKIFPPLLAQMVGVGEETGQLDEVLDKVSNYFASEVDHSVEGLSAALEPIILIALGVMVGVLILSIITPIYKLTTSI